MITLYIFISYMVMLGMMLETYDGESIPAAGWLMILISPIMLPIFIGAMLVEKSKDDE